MRFGLDRKQAEAKVGGSGMNFYEGKTAYEELQDICQRMRTCQTSDALVTVRLSTVRQMAVMLDKEYSGGQSERESHHTEGR